MLYLIIREVKIQLYTFQHQLQYVPLLILLMSAKMNGNDGIWLRKAAGMPWFTWLMNTP